MDVPALISLAFVASITPGPNNLMLVASGMNHGIRRTLPHMAGVSLGFGFLIFLVALGLGAVFEKYAAAELVLKIAGGVYLIYLARKIFKTSGINSVDGADAPMTFLQAAAFQWVNPKAWVMATTATSTLLDSDDSIIGGAAALTIGFWIVNLPCIATWMISGAYAARWVDHEKRIRLVNRTLGVLLVGTVALLVS